MQQYWDRRTVNFVTTNAEDSELSKSYSLAAVSEK